MGDINVELGRSRTAYISLDAAENGSYVAINTNSPSRPSSSNPASISEWYSYNHSYNPCPPAWQYDTQYCDGCTLVYRYHNGSCGYYYSYDYNSPACGCGGGYYCQYYPGDPCGIYSSPCWQLGLQDCGSGQAIQ